MSLQPSDAHLNNTPLHFDIDASVVFQLGESLITDVVQALVELVKNAYDADSDHAIVIVNTKETNKAEGSRYSDAIGSIVIEDAGDGMDLKTIQDGWLTISNSPKRKLKKENKTTAKGRTPLGDKGLGRLGVQRLGNNVEIFTRPKNSNVEYYVGFSWKDFASVDRLTQVPLVIDELKPRRKKGTKIIISDLKDIEIWTDKNAVDRLQVNLSQMISPYQKVRAFRALLKINNRRIRLAKITNDVRKAAQVRYQMNFDGEVLKIDGQAKLDFFRPNTTKGKNEFKALVEGDDGKQLFEFLATEKSGKQYNLQRSQKNGWFVDYSLVTKLSDLDQLKFVDIEVKPDPNISNKAEEGNKDTETQTNILAKSNGKRKQVPANPGPFTAEIDYFSLGTESASQQQDVFGSKSSYRTYIKDLSGIKVFRDGFGIRVDRDWLNLGEQWTSAGSYYALKPTNTMGYVAISARENAKLEETTDREGFKVTPYYENFYGLLRAFVSFSEEAHEFMRRGYIKFRNLHQDELANIDSDTTAEDISERIRHNLSQAKMYTLPLKTLEGTLDNAQQTIKSISTLLPDGTKELNKLQKEVRVLITNIDKGRETLQKVTDYLRRISDLETTNKSLQNRIETLNQQVEQMYEAAGLGLTAEALSHEIHNIADQLTDRTGQIEKYLQQQNIKDPKLLSFTDYISTMVSALHKQLAHLTPALRYLREKREVIDVLTFFEELKDHYKLKLQSQHIQINIKPLKAVDFTLYMNKGKLIQVFDNIFLNSEYWLNEDIRAGYVDHGTVKINISNPYVRVSDNGRGIDPSVEETLFHPFISKKGRGRGRGLGLFIAQQLLDSEGCTISLMPKRNQYGRLYIFEVDLTGALHGSD